MSLYQYKTHVELYHTDATGALFYGSLFLLIHQCFSAFLRDRGHSLKDLIDLESFHCPIVHVEGDFKLPLTFGDAITVEITEAAVGKSSFTLLYAVMHKTIQKASAKVIHVCLGAQGEKIEVPDKISQLILKGSQVC